MYAGIHAAKLNAGVGCRQLVASIGCSINFCIQSLSSSFNYLGKAKNNAGIYAAKLNASIGCRICLPVLDAA